MSLVTIAIPTYNRKDYLRLAVESALAQTHKEIEILISDNASTDGTASYLRGLHDPRIVIIEQPTNLGMVGNFNACLTNARGEFFLMLSDDDVLKPHAIEELAGPMMHGEGSIPAERIGLTWCPCTIIDSVGKPCWVTDGGPAIESPAELIVALWNGQRGPRFCSVMVRRADAAGVGGYQGDRYGEICDTGNWAKIGLGYEYVACVPVPLVQYRSHAGSLSRAAACRDWQQWGQAMFEDVRQSLIEQGISERTIRSTRLNLLANLTMTVLMPSIGQPGWAMQMCKEVARVWPCFCTPHVARRLLKETWKLVRFWRSGQRT